jgi:hypothetical protein
MEEEPNQRPREGLVLYNHSILSDEYHQLTWEYHSMIPYHLKSIDRHIHKHRQSDDIQEYVYILCRYLPVMPI